MNKILVVDDELSIRESFSLILEGKYDVLLAASGEGALKTIADQKVDVVYLDIRMPGMDGLETLKRLKEIDPDLEIIMVTAVNDVQKASEAIKLGARDYIVKPFDVGAVLKMTDAILRRRELIREGTKKPAQLIGQSEKIIDITKTIEKVAQNDLRVLILGEPGTEKELVAQLIHEKSSRSEGPFLTFNLSPQISPSEIKVRLFGISEGTTTIDLKKVTGLFEEARHGTVFLNNIEFLPLKLIAGQSTEARLIAACNLMDLAEKNRELFDFFSEGLISIPPLRERISDLPLLVNHFLEKYSEKYGKEVKQIAPEAMEAISNYDWPGNTAELESLLEKIVLTSTCDQITLDSLPLDILLKTTWSPGNEYFSSFEREFTRNAQGRTRTGTAYSAEGF